MIGWLAVAGYLGVVLAANWVVDLFGVVPVGFGFLAAAGVYAVGPALVLRSVVQWHLGKRVAILALLLGSIASYWVAAPAVATASALAFTISEGVDFAVFTWLGGRSVVAVLVGGVLGLVADSVVFVAVAFGSWDLLPGQLLGKLYGVIVGTALVAVFRRFAGVTPR